MAPNLMAVGAHADDIELSVGGTLLKYRDRGCAVVYVMSTNNMSGTLQDEADDATVTMRKVGPAETMAQRKAEAAAGAQALGTVPVHLDHPQRHYNGPDGQSIEVRYGCELAETVPADVPTILTAHEDPDSLERVTELILERAPDYVLTHSMAETDMEHLGTALLVTKSYWQAVDRGFAGGLLHWRCGHTLLGPMNCRWDTFVDISGYLERKLELIGLHRCQIPPSRLSRLDFPPRQRAIAWGTACNCNAAEVFTVVSCAKRALQYRDLALEITQNG